MIAASPVAGFHLHNEGYPGFKRRYGSAHKTGIYRISEQ